MNTIFSDLRASRTDVGREAVAVRLRKYVQAESRELSGETFVKFMNEVNKSLFELVNSVDVHEKLCGIVAIDELIDIDIEENATKITRFANYLRIVLPSSDQTIMLRASKALGHLARSGGTLTADFVEFEVKRALEWLQSERFEPRRHAAVLVLKELAENAPTLFYVHVGPFFDLVWVGLRDPKVIIREVAVQALRACLQLISERESRLRLNWYNKIFEEALKGIKGNSDSIHGSLLTFGELLLCTGDFMKERFKPVCEIFIKHRDHRDRLVRRTVITLLPRLAEYDPDGFVRGPLRTSMTHLLAALKKDNERPVAFVALGEIAVAVRDNISPYIDAMVALIRESISGRKSKVFCEESLVCLSMLAKAVGVHLSRYMTSLLDQLFSIGLSEALVDALMDVSQYITPLLPEIQQRLLDRLSLILCGAPFHEPGAPSGGQPPSPPAAGAGGSKTPRLQRSAPSSSSLATTGDAQDPGMIALALSTLYRFNFQSRNLSGFVRECTAAYLEDDNPIIRKRAALTCCKLLIQTDEEVTANLKHGYAARVVGEVLEKVMTVGIADPEPDVRLATLSALDSRFDGHLAQAENLRSLFIAFNDEIRETAISVIGRLTMRNPAYVMPSLRKTLIQLLTELEYSGDTRNKKESAQLIGSLIRASQRLIKPYVEPILKALMPKLRDTNAGVASQVLAAIGELALVGGNDMRPHFAELLPQIIETLQDQSSVSKREVALRTLGRLVQSTGNVVEPYNTYPNLLDILLTALTSEQSAAIRREILTVVGIIGAHDPYKYKMNQLRHLAKQQSGGEGAAPVGAAAEVVSIAPSSDDYYPTFAISALMKILRDPTLSTHHTMVIQAVMFIFKSLGLKCVPFLPQVMPPFLHVMQTCEAGFREFLFQQLGFLVSIVKQHIRDYLMPIFSLIKDHWDSSLLAQIITLVEEISKALQDEFKVNLAIFIPLMLKVLATDRTERRLPTLRVLRAIEVFGANTEDYLHLIVPAVLRLAEQIEAPVTVRLAALRTLVRLCRILSVSDHASRIVHPLSRILASPYQELRTEALEALCSLVLQLGSDFAVFIQTIGKVMATHRIQHARYEMLVGKLLRNEPLPADAAGGGADDAADDAGDDGIGDIPSRKLHVNQQNLKKAWEASQRSTREDWKEWIRRFSVELLRESPSPALRSCSALAQVYHPLARELFNVGFVSCWTELYDQFQDELVRSLELALNSPTIPPEILQTLLNLAEFMEHDDKALPIDIRQLGQLASDCHAYAKALHYKEIEFHSSPAATIEDLISINNQLQQPDAAVGILKYAQQQHNVALKESWYIKLNRWTDALEVYERKRVEDPLNLDLTLGSMRCLNALGEWERLSHLSHETWRNVDVDKREAVAPLAAAAAWNLGQWDRMDDYITAMKDKTHEKSFFCTLAAIHKKQYETAQMHVDRTRALLDTSLTALVRESYNRAYDWVVIVQQLAELEEVIAYLRTDQEEVRTRTREMWATRLVGCQRNVEVWQRILSVRRLVVPPRDDVHTWLKFAALCRKSSRLGLSYKTLVSLFPDEKTGELLEADPTHAATIHPAVAFGYFKHLWARGQSSQEKLATYERLSSFLDIVRASGDAKLLSRCHLKLGQWWHALHEDLEEPGVVDSILTHYKTACDRDESWYKAWHSWAMMSFEVVEHSKVDDAMRETHIVPAVRGFLRSIALGAGRGESVQDTLRLLTLTFAHGSKPHVEAALREGLGTVSVGTWLQVLPQVIARIHTNVLPVRRLICDLLTSVGKIHPQALVYSLTVASKSQSAPRQAAAIAILDNMREHSAELVEQAHLVSHELIRVSVLWHEQWYTGLDEASRLYYSEHNVEGMLTTLEPLHEMLEKGAETMREISFQQSFGHDLKEAREWCRKYKQSKSDADLAQAWDLYYHVFRKINKMLPQMTSLELQYVSPRLLEAHDLDLAVPGTYHPDRGIIHIKTFAPTLSVITSKQRPRKLTICGSDGKDHVYLLKGHEDLRQDERVMQLFGLVNTLLANDRDTSKMHLNIREIPVIPLSPNSGLIGWVPDCDTLHALIREYRESRKILLNMEHRLILQMAPDYDNLTLIQKVEVFDYSLENTTGQDLHRVLWLRSRNSEVWLERRTNYTRSLAVMSMVGYILGLGDRHPSNLMMERQSGKIFHIDFGDCFEVAQQRDKFPEKVPFRLTRMLVNAMEVSGIEGTYRTTCEVVMHVLRQNKDSLMAVLEAFVHDPLINWRLLTPADQPKEGGEHTAAGEPGALAAVGTIGHRGLGDRAEAEADAEAGAPEALNERAVEVIARISHKLTGRDFDPNETLDVPQQVQRLIVQATSHVNMCQSYIGWCPFW